VAIPRIYVSDPLVLGESLSLSAEVSHHLLQVLHVKTGDSLIVFNGEGGEFHAILQRDPSRRKMAMVDIVTHDMVNRESKIHVHLFQGVSRAYKMDYAIQKAVELGVSAITPVMSERCVVRLNEKKQQSRHSHWQRLVVSACEQSGRTRIPALTAVVDFSTALKTALPGVFLQPNSDYSISTSMMASTQQFSVWVGPEGGWSDMEAQQATVRGFQSVSLGNRILRTETAPVAILAAIQTLWGDY
jgi:16S rRNA (uracil1498-N3)-methyltransferase